MTNQPPYGMMPTVSMPPMTSHMMPPMGSGQSPSQPYHMQVPYGMMPTMSVPPQMTTNSHQRGPVPSAAPPFVAYPYPPK